MQINKMQINKGSRSHRYIVPGPIQVNFDAIIELLKAGEQIYFKGELEMELLLELIRYKELGHKNRKKNLNQRGDSALAARIIRGGGLLNYARGLHEEIVGGLNGPG
jgi:hypothetical protein